MILARFKIAIVLEGGYARYVTGRRRQPADGGVRPIVLDMMENAAELAQTTEL